MLQDPMQMVTDQELMRVLTEMRVDHPDYGETMAMGHLRTQGSDRDCARQYISLTLSTLHYGGEMDWLRGGYTLCRVQTRYGI